MQAAAAHKATVARFPVKRAGKPKPEVDTSVVLNEPQTLQMICSSNASKESRPPQSSSINCFRILRPPPLDEPARLKLQRLIFWFGA